MATRADLRANVTSTFDGRGFKDAEASARAMEREFAKLDAEARKQQQLIDRVNESQRSAMSSSGKWVLGISAAAAAGLALTTKAAMDWESAWAGVLKTVDGTDAQLDALEDSLRQMARSMPVTHDEIAAVAEAAGQLGVATEDVAAFSKTMLQLGTATNMTSEEAATAIAQLSNIMGTSVDDVSRLGATVVALGNNSATTESNIVSMAQRMAGSAAIIGMSEAETLSLAAALSSVGIEVEAGGTAISRVMTDIAKAVGMGGDELTGFADVAGMSADEFARAFRDDPTEAIITFVEGLGSIDAAGGSVFQTLTDLGLSDVRVSRALLSMSNSGDLLRDSIELGNQAWEDNIALVEEANKRYETTESKLQIARNQINDAAIDIGGNLLPVLAGAVSAVGSMAEGFGALPDGAKTFVTWLGTAATGVGLLGGTALIAVPKLHEFKATVDALAGGQSRLGKLAGGAASVLTGPWGIALAGATIGVSLWAKAQGEARQKTTALAETLDVQTGALTENSTAWIQNELTKEQNFGIGNSQSMVTAAREMGIGIDTLTAAYAGNTEAIAVAKEAANRWADENYSLTLASASQADRFNRNLDDQAERLENAREIQEAKLAIDAAATDQTGDLADATGLAAGAQDDLADGLSGTTDEAEAAAEALEALKQALTELNSPTLDLSDAQIAWAATIAEVTAQLEENGKNLDLNTEAGRANQSFLNDMARDAMTLANALLTESSSEAEFRVSLEQSRAALAETAQQFGMTEEDAWAYVDSVLAIPPAAVTGINLETGNAQLALNGLLVEIDGADGTVTVNGEAADAKRTLGELIGNIDDADGTVTINGNKVPADVTLSDLLAVIDGSKATTSILANDSEGRKLLNAFVSAIAQSTGTVYVYADMSNAYASLNRFVTDSRGRQVTLYGRMRQGYDVAQADGSIMDFYGNGGVRRESHVAQIAPAGAWRVWAEPETGGEAYIPLHPSKRARSEDILGDVAHRFGMYVGRYADGAITGGSAASRTSQVVMPTVYTPPSHLTVVDADGALIGTMRVIAADTAAEWVGA